MTRTIQRTPTSQSVPADRRAGRAGPTVLDQVTAPGTALHRDTVLELGMVLHRDMELGTAAGRDLGAVLGLLVSRRLRRGGTTGAG
jgi:hypothetical protein